jgi:hypothetical protein
MFPFFDEVGSVKVIYEFSGPDECIWWNAKQGINADLYKTDAELETKYEIPIKSNKTEGGRQYEIEAASSTPTP